ncbi:MAG: polysaccharide deacetylase family protein [bacterium]|nr:polysaccharide deacetylase family protein [bacterium]
MRQAKSRTALHLARALSAEWSRPHWRILCYHGVDPEEKESFARQLAWFAERFTFCTISEGAAFLKSNSLSRPILSVTFDDGDRTVYDVALAVLESFGIKATLYVTADYVVRGRLYRESDAPPAITWEQIRDWAARGHEIGSHSLTHAPMPLCSPKRFEQEVSGSRAILEDIISRPVVHFSYPWGQYNKSTTQRLIELGLYQTSATIHRGAMVPGHDLLCLRRDVIHPRMSVQEVETTMRFADRFYWLRHLKRNGKGYWVTHPEVSWDEAVHVNRVDPMATAPSKSMAGRCL